MTNLRRRLKQLEAQFTDSTGRVPHSPAWTDYWTQVLEKVLAEDYFGPKAPVPLEVVRAHLQSEPDCE